MNKVTENTKRIIGQRINELLAINDVKQKELAAHLSIPDNTVSYFVKGARVPNTEQIIKIAQYFNVSTDYLLGLSDVQTSDTSIKGICEYTGLSKEAVICLHEKCCKKMEVISENAKKKHNKTDITLLQNIYKERYIDNASELFILGEFIINKNSLLRECIKYIKHQRLKTEFEKYIHTVSNNYNIGYKELIEELDTALQNAIGDCEYQLFKIQHLMLSFINALTNKVINKDIIDIKSNEALFYSADIERLKECVDYDIEFYFNNGNDK